MSGGIGTGKIKRRKKETKEQIRLSAIEWLLRKLFETTSRIEGKVNKLIDWKRKLFLKEEIEKVEEKCKHQWEYCDKYDIWECSKCGKWENAKYLKTNIKWELEEKVKKECDHNWVCITKNSYNPDGTIRDWTFECSKCGKREIKRMEVAIWESEEGCKHNWIRANQYKHKGYSDDWVVECSKCGKRTFESYLKCEHNWVLKDAGYNFETSKTEWWLECKKCGKGEWREITDKLMYKLTRICNNHKWIKEYETVNAEGTVVRKTYKCSICGKINIEVKCIHHWIYITEVKKKNRIKTVYECNRCGKTKTEINCNHYHKWEFIAAVKKGENFTLELDSLIAEEDGVICKCRICEMEKIEYKATLEDYAIGMKKVVDALPTAEQAAKNFLQALCNHNWVKIKYPYKDFPDGWIFECSKCGVQKFENIEECEHNWVMVNETWKDEGDYEVLLRKFKCTKCGRIQSKQCMSYKDNYAERIKRVEGIMVNFEKMKQNFCEHNWVLIGGSSSPSIGNPFLRINENIYKCSKCEQRKTERY